MAWKGFLKESVSYVNPRGLKEWAIFIINFPRAYYRYWKLNRSK